MGIGLGGVDAFDGLKATCRDQWLGRARGLSVYVVLLLLFDVAFLYYWVPCRRSAQGMDFLIGVATGLADFMYEAYFCKF